MHRTLSNQDVVISMTNSDVRRRISQYMRNIKKNTTSITTLKKSHNTTTGSEQGGVSEVVVEVVKSAAGERKMKANKVVYKLAATKKIEVDAAGEGKKRKFDL